MDALSVSVLGPLRITLGGHPLERFRSRKVPALLIYLVVEAGVSRHPPPRRETLMHLLWPERPRATAQENLRQICYQLRREIPAVAALDGRSTVPLLASDRERVGLHPQAWYSLDAVELVKTTPDDPSLATLEAAAALYRGDFLTDLYLPDSDEFEQWAATHRARLRRRALGVMAELTARLLAQDEVASAEDFARRQIAIEPLEERAHQQLITALARQGRRAQALRQAERWRRMLADELGVTPSRETEALVERLRIERSIETGRSRRTLRNRPSAAPLIGRERELSELDALVADPEVRLLTLLGPGGIGKSRLGLALVERYIARGGDGCFVPLAPLSSPAQLASAIADALEIDVHPGAEPEAQLAAALRARDLLLVLDNFEHLLGTENEADRGTRFVADLLRATSRLTVIATSRERLNLSTEWLFVVDGLEVPVDGDELGTSAAGRLFLKQARRVRRDGGGTQEVHTAIARICRQVGGMPLAIELAASWGSTMSWEELAVEIERSLEVLAASFHDLPERHRSLQAIFEQSWSTLSAAERRLFRGLSVFRGPFTERAVEAICAPDADTLPAAGAQPAHRSVLAALVGKSFVRCPRPGRYELHELLRQFGVERLREDPAEWETIHERHATYYLGFVTSHESALKGAAHRRALDKIADEFPNVHRAWYWALDRRRADLLDGLGDSLWLFYDRRRAVSEALTLFADTLAALDGPPLSSPGRESHRRRLLARATALVGGIHTRLGDYRRGYEMLARAVAALGVLGARREQALALDWLGVACYHVGEYDEARQRLEQCIALARSEGDRWLTAYALNDLAMVAQQQGDGNAVAMATESLSLFREIDDLRGAAFALDHLGVLAHHRHHRAEAERLLRESLTLRRADGDSWGVTTTLTHLGAVARARGESHAARITLRDALESAREVHVLPFALAALVEVAALWLHEGRSARAHELLEICRRHPALDRQTREQIETLAARPAPEAGPTTPAFSDDTLDPVVAVVLEELLGR